jgi:hypothetical protein
MLCRWAPSSQSIFVLFSKSAAFNIERLEGGILHALLFRRKIIIMDDSITKSK